MSETNKPQGPEKEQPHFSARVPEKVARGVYSSAQVVIDGPKEVLMDFLMGLTRPYSVVSRVIMVPQTLTEFANALENHTLLKAEYTEMLTTGKVDTPRGRYGYGFGDQTINGSRCFGHGGGAPGMNGELEICPGPGYVVVVLSNMDPPAASRISDFITNRLPKE